MRARVPLVWLAQGVAGWQQLAPELPQVPGGAQALRARQKPAPRPKPLEQVAPQPQQNQAGDPDPPR